MNLFKTKKINFNKENIFGNSIFNTSMKRLCILNKNNNSNQTQNKIVAFKKFNITFKKIKSNRNFKSTKLNLVLTNELLQKKQTNDLSFQSQDVKNKNLSNNKTLKSSRSGLYNVKFLCFILQKINIFIRKFFSFSKLIIRKTIELFIIYLLIYFLCKIHFFENIIKRISNDTSYELKKLLKQVYIGDINDLINDILCDFLEEPRFVRAIDNVIISIYKDELLMTYIKNLFWEVFSIFLKDPNHGSLLNTFLVRALGNPEFVMKGKQFFKRIIDEKNPYLTIQKYILKMLEDQQTKILIYNTLQRYFLYYLDRNDLAQGFQEYFHRLLFSGDLFFYTISYLLCDYRADEQYQNEKGSIENYYLNGDLMPFDNNKYLIVKKIDFDNKKLKEALVTGYRNTFDFLECDEFDFDPLTLNDGRRGFDINSLSFEELKKFNFMNLLK